MGVAGLSDGRLWVLGGSVELPAHVSWLPASAYGWEPVSAYLLLEDDGALLVDTGVGAHWDVLLAGLEQVVGDRPVDVYFTRFEQDCISNLGRIFARGLLGNVFAGGTSFPPLEYFEEVTRGLTRPQIDELFRRVQYGDTVQIGANRELEPIRAVLRILATSWAYDAATGTLFTSDSFGHVQAEDPEQRVARPGATTPEQVREHLFTKFDWLADLEDPEYMAEQVKAVFDERDVQRIAPTHGCLIQGAEEVAWHRDQLLAAIRDCKTARV